MGKSFRINTKAIDPDKNQTTESILVNGTLGSVDLPQVSFVFPATVPVEGGSVTGPIWGSGVYKGFAYCLVTPTPNGGDGTFLVQYYYNSGEYPNSPARRFHKTFDGVGSTLSAAWAFNKQSLSLDGGGTIEYGFANQNDVSGLRKALILSTTDQGSASNPNRIGGRTLDTDGIIAAYNHDLVNTQLQTISIYQKGKETTNGIERTSWPDDTFIFFHPYYYVPVYTNNNMASINVMPYIMVAENNKFYQLKGRLTVSGTNVTASNSDFLTQMPSGNHIIKFQDSESWYLVSGILSSSGLKIYDYGDGLYLTNQVAVTTRYTLGSGLIKILPDLSGCNLWDVSLSPEYADGATIPGNSVAYTANFTGSISPSGTAKYDWTVITLSGTTTTVSGLTNGGNTLTVEYLNGIKKNVRVSVSGTGQAECVHTDETGLIELKPAIDTGTWSSYLQGVYYLNVTGDVRNNHTWFRLGSLPGAGKYFHHWRGTLKHLSAELTQNTISTAANNLVGPAGAFADWPNSGSFVLNHNYSGNRWKGYFGSYSGKSSGSTSDTLNNVSWHKSCEKSTTDNRVISVSSSVSNVTIGAGTKILNIHNNMHFPMTYIIAKSSDGLTIKVEDVRRIADVRYSGKKKFWIATPGRNPVIPNNNVEIHVVEAASINYDTNEIKVTKAIGSDFGNYGDQIVVAPWSHWKNNISSSGNNVESTGDTNWNIFEQSLFWVLNVNETSNTSYETNPDYSLDGGEVFTLTLWCPLPNILRGTNYTDYKNNATNYNFLWIPPKGRIVIPFINRKNVVIEYTSIEERATPEGDLRIKLLNCRTVAPESDPSTTTPGTKFRLGLRGFGFLHKNVRFDGIWTRTTLEGTDPNLTYEDISPSKIHFGRNNVYMDLIYGNQSATDQFSGSIGTWLARPIWEENLLRVSNGFVDKAIPMVDPIYVSNWKESNGGGSTGGTGGGGCIYCAEIVSIQKFLNAPDELCQIDDVEPGWFVQSSAGYQRIKCVKRTKHNECLTINTSTKSLRATGEHPIATDFNTHKQSYVFTPARDLVPGQAIYTNSGGFEIITSIEKTVLHGTYIDLETENPNDFYVNGILVHNKSILNPTTLADDFRNQ